MREEDHLEKAGRIESLRDRLDPKEDYELWYWASLVVGMNLLNAALHRLGATVAEDCFAHNLPVYIRAGQDPGTFEPVVRTSGDLEHVTGEENMRLIPAELEGAARALVELETVRDPGVRGDLEITEDVTRRVDAAYRACADATRAVLGGGASEDRP